MVYRRTDNVARKLAARHAAILRAAAEIADGGGMGAVQIAPVAGRAGIAAGTVYRYFPSKSDLVAALIASLRDEEVAALRQAAAAAPGPLSALAAAIATFAARALRRRRLLWAAMAEPVDADVAPARIGYRRAVSDEFQAAIGAAIASGRLPEQDAGLAAAALVGGLIEATIGPLAPPDLSGNAAREAVQTLTLLALRGLGVFDARARGLVVQTALPVIDGGS
jgi:AcrR family transcriptional regulator